MIYAIARCSKNLVLQLQRLDKERGELEKTNFEKMYRWLSTHQNPRSGLVISYEGASDIKNWAFIYDQSLVAQVYNNASDYIRVRKVLDFFARSAQRSGGLFYNAYYVNDGMPAEYTVHSGPNIWLGIAALRYTNRAGDSRFLPLADDIASAIIRIQSEDPEGGIRGGPSIDWYSTEHNLDAYSFFNLLHAATGRC